MKYYSSSHRKMMDIEDMHMMHIENVLLKQGRKNYISRPQRKALVAEYIAKTQANREHLNKDLKAERATTRILMDLIMRTRKPQRSPEATEALRTRYKDIAFMLIDSKGVASADEVRNLAQRWGYPIDGRVLSHLFRDKDFKQAHYKRSTWLGAHGRYINTWKAA